MQRQYEVPVAVAGRAAPGATPCPVDPRALRAAFGGVPSVGGALARFARRKVDMPPTGGHALPIGELTARSRAVGDPLVFFAGDYQQIQ